MGYSRKEIQLLGGGWNILPPGDKTPITDYLLGQNWRNDRVGKLVSRAGYVAGPNPGSYAAVTYLHSACQGAGTDLYAAGNDTLGFANPGHMYYNGTLTWNGLSGNRVGMVFMNGWLWFMDQSVQGRHNAGSGAHFWNLTVEGLPTACTAAAGSADANGPSGTYQIYVTFSTVDGSSESNPGPASSPVTVSAQDINLTAIPICPAAIVGGGLIRNIYATGGTLGQAYLVGTIPNNTATTFIITTGDLAATLEGIVMPIDHDGPPAAAGMIGPYFGCLAAWNSTTNVNRLWYTQPGLPQYWNTDPAVGDWVDVGEDGEHILWCTMHSNVLVIYKERSTWWLIGDFFTGTLERVDNGQGAVNSWGICNCGTYDAFVSPGGLMRFDPTPAVTDISAPIRPLFQSLLSNAANPLLPPGRVAAATGTPFGPYDISLGYGNGKLYVAYGEAGNNSGWGPMLVSNGQRWFYHRNGVATLRFYGFVFTGLAMYALSGLSGTGGIIENVDDFVLGYTKDNNSATIECVYQSHYEDCGLPDNQKVWLEVVIDYEFASDTATVKVSYDNGVAAATNLGTITGTQRQSTSFPLGTDGVLAKNISVIIDCVASNLVIIHNVYLYYYVEARLGRAAATIPLDLGSPKVKQCKELQLDIDATNGAVSVNLYSDLPGNALSVRQTPSVAMGGRAVFKYPFALTEGFLWRVALHAATPFRLYSARLLMRVVGVYVEAYESTAGFVYDTFEHTFESLITKIPRMYAIALAATPIKRFREIQLEIETFSGNVTATFITDLPGNAQATRATFTVNTGAAGRRIMRLPLPAGVNSPVEGRLCRLQLSGTSKFLLYEAAVELLAMGVYVEAYEASGGAVWDSRELDFGSAKPKEAREIELDIETSGSITWTLYSDLPGYVMASQATGTASTTGREKIKIPLLTGSPVGSLYPMGRLFRVILTGANAFRLYDVKLRLREFGAYLTGDEVSGGGVWDSTPMDMEVQYVKQFKKIELDLITDGTSPVSVTVYTEQSGSLAQIYQNNAVNTNGVRYSLSLPLTPGARGRLIQVVVSGNGVRLFAGRVFWRALNHQDAKWDWAPLPIPPTPPVWADAPMPINPTPPGSVQQDPAQWVWGKFLSVEPTSEDFQFIDAPFEVVE